MHRPGIVSSELGFLPSLYPISGLNCTTDLEMSRRSAEVKQLAAPSVPSSNWERRCLRKHKRRTDDESCSAKRRRLMREVACVQWEVPSPDPVPVHGLRLNPSPSQPSPLMTEPGLPYLGSPSAQPLYEAEGSCMEVEAAQRRLQEIEERITLEDDDDDDDDDDDEEEGLDVEPAQSRPVLVMSDSLREGLQRGVGDILPHSVAQSVSRSCMELVVWRPPEEALPRKLKESLQRQRKQSACRQPPPALATKAPEREAPAVLYCSPDAQSSAEEDMEL